MGMAGVGMGMGMAGMGTGMAFSGGAPFPARGFQDNAGAGDASSGAPGGGGGGARRQQQQRGVPRTRVHRPNDYCQHFVVGRCKLDPGLKSTTRFQKFNCEKDDSAFNLNLVVF